ncbi:phosphoribosylformylglycinamidine cyclo-ligase [Thiohalorhabdus denitrificans]|uniref:Phosphoribosylformylglycinamidine cyclo-ligase n=1 Tax=Thiohalorhabdus denitrificans TaxID=381306 RepID=A0A1G5ENN2_9GAMM|nr:phosphoribosylformylglycinamidine cyclo-ligase [Thiohalorhabdus denitrificans]
MAENSGKPLTYKEAGVDVAAGDAFVDRIKPLVKRTSRPEVLGGLGGFGGLFRLASDRYRDPVLVAGTDGVGTKLRLAIELDRHDSVGVDLVAMCVNDLIVCGAEPLFFLDYLATGKLDPERASAVVAGIVHGCEAAGCALLGGETAEMPGMYAGADYDLAGFAVGVVERDGLIDGSRADAGDVLIGLPSSGVHSNGFSLVRRLLQDTGTALDAPFGDTTLGEALLTPTRIYVAAVRALLEAVDVRALAHITGGGLPGNLPRSLPEGLGAELERGAWPRPPILDWIQEQGAISEAEMLATFNAGLGMVAVVPEAQAEAALDALHAAGETGYRVGRLTTDAEERVRLHD